MYPRYHWLSTKRFQEASGWKGWLLNLHRLSPCDLNVEFKIRPLRRANAHHSRFAKCRRGNMAIVGTPVDRCRALRAGVPAQAHAKAAGLFGLSCCRSSISNGRRPHHSPAALSGSNGRVCPSISGCGSGAGRPLLTASIIRRARGAALAPPDLPPSTRTAKA